MECGREVICIETCEPSPLPGWGGCLLSCAPPPSLKRVEKRIFFIFFCTPDQSASDSAEVQSCLTTLCVMQMEREESDVRKKTPQKKRQPAKLSSLQPLCHLCLNPTDRYRRTNTHKKSSNCNLLCASRGGANWHLENITRDHVAADRAEQTGSLWLVFAETDTNNWDEGLIRGKTPHEDASAGRF